MCITSLTDLDETNHGLDAWTKMEIGGFSLYMRFPCGNVMYGQLSGMRESYFTWGGL